MENVSFAFAGNMCSRIRTCAEKGRIVRTTVHFGSQNNNHYISNMIYLLVNYRIVYQMS